MLTTSGDYREIFKLILDYLAKTLELGVVFIQKNENIDEYYKLNTRRNFCEFCSTLAKDPKLALKCNDDHQIRGLSSDVSDPQICHAGLYNLSFPIKVNNELIASILVGQRKFVGREEESQDKLMSLLGRVGISDKKKETLIGLFGEIPAIEEKDLKEKTKNHLPFIHNLLNHILTQEQYTRARIDSLAHELMLPLQSLIILSENIKDETYEKSFDLEFIRNSSARILFEVSKLGFYAQNIRKIMQLFTIKSEYESKIIPIYPLIEQARTRFTLEAEEKSVLLKAPSYTKGPFPKLKIVQDEFMIALNNLYSNAIKYSYSGHNEPRHITTECDDVTEEGKYFFSLAISNFGVPILQEEITRGEIFKIGHRGVHSRDRNRTGSGVGLYLTREIIEKLHGGKIKVQSIDKQSGYLTTITILIPYLGEE